MNNHHVPTDVHQWRQLLEAEETRSNRLAAANSVLRETQQFLVDKCTAMSNDYSRRVAELETELARRNDMSDELIRLQDTMAHMEHLSMRLDGKEAECTALRHELEEVLDENKMLRDQVETLQDTVEKLVEAQQENRRMMREMAGIQQQQQHVQTTSSPSLGRSEAGGIGRRMAPMFNTSPPTSTQQSGHSSPPGNNDVPLTMKTQYDNNSPNGATAAAHNKTYHHSPLENPFASVSSTPPSRYTGPAAIQSSGRPRGTPVFDSVLPMMAALKELNLVIDADTKEPSPAAFDSSGSMSGSPLAKSLNNVMIDDDLYAAAPGLGLLTSIVLEGQLQGDGYYDSFEALQKVQRSTHPDTAAAWLEAATISKRVERLLGQAARAISVENNTAPELQPYSMIQPVDGQSERILEKLRLVEEENASMRLELEELLNRANDEEYARELLQREDAKEWQERATTILAASENLRNIALKNEEKRRWKERNQVSTGVNTAAAPSPPEPSEPDQMQFNTESSSPSPRGVPTADPHSPPKAPPVPSNYSPPPTAQYAAGLTLHGYAGSQGGGRSMGNSYLSSGGVESASRGSSIDRPPSTTTSRIFVGDAAESTPVAPGVLRHQDPTSSGEEHRPKLGVRPLQNRQTWQQPNSATWGTENTSAPVVAADPSISEEPVPSEAAKPEAVVVAKLPLKLPMKLPTNAGSGDAPVAPKSPVAKAPLKLPMKKLPLPAESSTAPTDGEAPKKLPLKLPAKSLPSEGTSSPAPTKLPLKLPMSAPSPEESEAPKKLPLKLPAKTLPSEGSVSPAPSKLPLKLPAKAPEDAEPPKKLPLKLPAKTIPGGDSPPPMKKLPLKLPMKQAPSNPMPSFDEVDDPEDAASLSTAPPAAPPKKLALLPKKAVTPPGSKSPIPLKKLPLKLPPK